MNQTRLAIVIPGFLVPGLAAAVGPVIREGTLDSGTRYTLRVEERPYFPAPNEAPDDGSRWGIDGGFPLTYVAVYELRVNGEQTRIPRKLYEDLSSVHRASVLESDGVVQVELVGGDAAGSYRAIFTFRRDEIERVVRHGEEPNAIWERTVVHNSMEDQSDD